MNLKNILLISAFALLTYLLSILFVSLFSNFDLVWVSFTFWILSIIALPFFIIFNNRYSFEISKQSVLKITKNELLLLSLILISILFSFIFLKNYPFVSIGDEVRDGGLNAFQIYSGQIKNIFDYGRYQSHGLIIPTIGSFFYLLFHNSVLTYRFPSAIISVLTVVIIYFTVRMFLNKRAAFFAGLTLITSHFFLYYMRTEIVISFTGLLTALIIFVFGIYKKYDRIEYYALLGLTLGLSSGFHASARTIVFITLFLFCISELFSLIKKKEIKKQLTGIGLLIFYYIVGFGPKILYTTPEIFFHTRTITAINQTGSSQIHHGPIPVLDLKLIASQYLNSFHMFFDKPLVTIPFHYQSPEILFPIVIGIFIFFGIISVFLFRSNNFFKYLLFYFLMIPLLNSSLTDCYQCNYRLLPLIIVSSIFAGIGIERLLFLFKKFSNQVILAIGIIISVYLLFQGAIFFQNNLASIGKNNQDYLSMHAIYTLNENREIKESNKLCIYASPNNFNYLNLMHIQEQYQYFLPNKYIYVIESNVVRENEIYASKSCSGLGKKYQYKEYKYCSSKNKFTCPEAPVSFSIFLKMNDFSSSEDLNKNQRIIEISPKALIIP